MPYTTLLRSDREMGGMRSLLDRDDIKLQVAGHETFPCRYGWLKKSYDAVCEELAVEDEQQKHAFSPNVGIGKFGVRSEEHTSELQSLMRISYDVFCLKKKTQIHSPTPH